MVDFILGKVTATAIKTFVRLANKCSLSLSLFPRCTSAGVGEKGTFSSSLWLAAENCIVGMLINRLIMTAGCHRSQAASSVPSVVTWLKICF